MQSAVIVFPAAAQVETRPLYNAPVEESFSSAIDFAALRSYLVEQLKSAPSRVNIADFEIENTAENETALRNLIWNNIPEAFHVFGLGVQAQGDYLVSVAVTYYDDYKENYQLMLAQCEAAAEKLVAGIKDSGLSQAEIALVLHDRLNAYCAYDYDNLLAGTVGQDSHCMYGALVNRVSVCQGYAMAYQYLLRKVGIDSYYCSSRQLNHGWNIVKIDGKWYHVDCTWDDPVWDKRGRVFHNNFLLSSTAFYDAGTEGHRAEDYDTTPTDTTYDSYYWQDSKTQICLVDGYLYYILSGGSKLYRRKGDDVAAVTNANYSWMTDGGCWIGNFSRLVTDGEKLYYIHNGSLYSYDPDTAKAEKLYTPELTGYYGIGGLALEDDTIYMDIYENPNKSQKVTTLTYKLRAVDSIAVSQLPAKTVYDIGESLDTTGLEITVTYSDGGTKTITEGFGLSTLDTTGEGSKEITVTYEDKTAAFTVTVDCITHTEFETVVTVIAATCGADGVGKKVCTLCGVDIQTDIVLSATGEHTPGEWEQITAPTYTETGLEQQRCSNCPAILGTREIEVLPCNHPFGSIEVDVEPTCSNDGVGHSVCGQCGNTLTSGITLPATGEHVASSNIIVDTAPTCSTVGTAHKPCIICGTPVQTGIEIPVTNIHSWDKGQITKQPTQTQAGVKTFTCTLCPATKTQTIAPAGVKVITIFKDLKAKDWYVKNGAIDFAYNNGLFNGTSKTTFGPGENMTRGMFVTVLGRLSGIDVKKISANTRFFDVAPGQYYAKYVKWASDHQIVNGISDTEFCPNANVTREQICAMMLRYCDYRSIKLKKVNAAIVFADAKKISSYARKAVTACQMGGIVGGKGEGIFDPTGNATRAEVATIMMNFYKNYIAG